MFKKKSFYTYINVYIKKGSLQASIHPVLHFLSHPCFYVMLMVDRPIVYINAHHKCTGYDLKEGRICVKSIYINLTNMFINEVF